MRASQRGEGLDFSATVAIWCAVVVGCLLVVLSAGTWYLLVRARRRRCLFWQKEQQSRLNVLYTMQLAQQGCSEGAI